MVQPEEVIKAGPDAPKAHKRKAVARPLPEKLIITIRRLSVVKPGYPPGRLGVEIRLRAFLPLMGGRRFMTTTTETKSTEAEVPTKKVITHDGVFHADDVFAVTILRGTFDASEVVRTRDEEQMLGPDVVIVDVGGEYDEYRNRFDHHQPGGAARRHYGDQEEYAAAGLVWRHFGARYVTRQLRDLLPGDNETTMVPRSIARKVDRTLIRHIDAADTGARSGVGYSVSAVISSMNPTFTEDANPDDAFREATNVAEVILNRAVAYAYAEEMADKEVLAALNREAYLERALVLERFVPWQAAAIKHCAIT